MWGEYIKYLKDNPEGYWFRRKLFGLGWTPATWQGWLTIGIFIALIILNAFRINGVLYDTEDIFTEFIPQTILLVILLLAICWKTGEPLKWQWGFPKKSEKKDQKKL